MREFSQDTDILASTEIAQSIGLHPWEIANDPEKTAKFNEIAEYFTPFDDKSFILQKLTRGMMKDQAVEHVWKYVNIRKEHSRASEKLESLKKELERYEQ